MGSFVVYILEWALCLSAFLLLYKMCFSGSTFHRFNRLFLLGSVVLSALLPLIHITTDEQMEPIAEVCRFNTAPFEPLSVAAPLQIAEVQESLTTGQRVFVVLTLTYLLYIVIQAIGWLRSMVKMILFLHGKRSRRVGRWIRLVVHDEEYGPFSWMNCIVISDKESGFGRRASMHHELSHIKLLHPLDLMFILLCTVVNPVCWLVMKEIKVVHEYEADDEVINHYHIRSRDYQRLLIQRTVGAEAYALACSFNLNIKKRIMMMKKKQSTWWRIAWIAVTLPLVGFALTAFSKPKEALKDVVDNSVRIIEQPIVEALAADAAESEVVETPAPEPVKITEPQQPAPEVKAGDLIKGTVKDATGPLMGAVIVEIDEYGRIVANGITDVNGNYAFKVKDPKHKIRISYEGLKTLTFDISSNQIDATMETNMKIANVKVVARHDSIDRSAPRYNDDHTNDNDSDLSFNIVEKTPIVPGGQAEIMKYLSTHLRYPAVASEMQIEAEVTVTFIVDKTGFVRAPKVVNVTSQTPLVTEGMKKIERVEAERNYNDAIEALKEEAIHVVRNMPRWEPGRQNGVRVETPYTLPVSFSIDK